MNTTATIISEDRELDAMMCGEQALDLTQIVREADDFAHCSLTLSTTFRPAVLDQRKPGREQEGTRLEERVMNHTMKEERMERKRITLEKKSESERMEKRVVTRTIPATIDRMDPFRSEINAAASVIERLNHVLHRAIKSLCRSFRKNN